MKTPNESMATVDMSMNEILPGLESFLRSMLHSKHLDKDHRQVAAMYIDKLDHLIKNTKSSQQLSSTNENTKQKEGEEEEEQQQQQENKVSDDLKQQPDCYNDQTIDESKQLNLNTMNENNILSHQKDHSLEEIIFDDESDDFTDEEEEERQQQQKIEPNGQTELSDEDEFDDELEESSRIVPCSETIPTENGHSLNNHGYDSWNGVSNKSNHSNHSQWYIDTPKNDYLEALTPLSNNKTDYLSNGNDTENVVPNIPNTPRLSTSTSSSIIADGLLLTYENQTWIWRYYVLDDYDLICFTTDKKTNETPLWVTDITGAKVQTTIIDKTECLCLQIGLSEAIYVRPVDQSQLPIWLKAFRDASIAQISKDNNNVNRPDHQKERNNSVKSLSKNARRMFQQFNRKKGQIVSQLLEQVANVAGVDDKTRKHCELRGFLVISCDNVQFLTKYCTIVDGSFRVHKSRLSDQYDYELCLQQCTLTFPEEKTRDVQFALIDHSSKHQQQLFIRGNNIYSMGRLLNTLAKYVEIVGSSQLIFSQQTTPIISKQRVTNGTSCSSQSHIYSDVDSSSRGGGGGTDSIVPSIMGSQSITNIRGQSKATPEIYSPSSIKSLPVGKFKNNNEHTFQDQSLNDVDQVSSLKKKTVYRNASKLYGVADDDKDAPAFLLPLRRHSNDALLNSNGNKTNHHKHRKIVSSKNNDKPKSYDNIPEQINHTSKRTLSDHNNNHYNRINAKKNGEQHRLNNSMTELPLTTSNINHRKSPIKPPFKQIEHQRSDSISNSVPSSPDSSVFCLRTESSHRNSRRNHNNNNSNNNHSQSQNRSVSSVTPYRNRKPDEIKSPTSSSSDYVTRLANLFSRSFSSQPKPDNGQQQQQQQQDIYNKLNEKETGTQTYSTYLDNQQHQTPQQSPSKNVAKRTSFRSNNQNHNQTSLYNTRLSRDHHLTAADISLPLVQDNNENHSTAHFPMPTTIYDTKQNGWSETGNNNTMNINQNYALSSSNVLPRTELKSKRVYDIPITIERKYQPPSLLNDVSLNEKSSSHRPVKLILTPFQQYSTPITLTSSSRTIEPIFQNNRTLLQDVEDEINRKKIEEEEESPYGNHYDNCRNDSISPTNESHHYRSSSPLGVAKFRFVIPFNHSPTSPFGTITTNTTASQKIIKPSKSNSSSPSSISSCHSSSTVCYNGSLSSSMSTTGSNSTASNYLNKNNSNNNNNNSRNDWSPYKPKQIQMKNYSSISTNVAVASTNNYNRFNQVTNGSNNTETEV